MHWLFRSVQVQSGNSEKQNNQSQGVSGRQTQTLSRKRLLREETFVEETFAISKFIPATNLKKDHSYYPEEGPFDPPKYWLSLYSYIPIHIWFLVCCVALVLLHSIRESLFSQNISKRVVRESLFLKFQGFYRLAKVSS